MQNKDLLRQFGARIRALRLEKKLSQEELSYKTGFHRTYIGMVERGERNISLSNIGVFADVFGIPLSELFNLPPAEAGSSPKRGSIRKKP